jgi:FMN phosphatase YigB (HAD superfamily)
MLDGSMCGQAQNDRVRSGVAVVRIIRFMIKAVIFDCFGVIYSSGFRTFMYNTVPEEQREAARELFRAYDKGLLSQESLLAQVSELIDVPTKKIEAEVFSGFKLDESLLA